MNPRIQIMLDSRRLEEAAAADGEVEGMWRKALRTLASSSVPGLDAEARFTLAYQAALQVSTAIVRAAGFRVRGEAHHHHTFAAVAALSLGELSEAARDLNVIRQRRHDAVYDWESDLDEGDVREIREATQSLFTQAEPWLRVKCPAIEPLPAAPTS